MIPCFLWDIYDNNTQTKTYITVLNVNPSSATSTTNNNCWVLTKRTFELEYENKFRVRVKNAFSNKETSKNSTTSALYYESLNIKGLKTVHGKGFFDGYNESNFQQSIFGECSSSSTYLALKARQQLGKMFGNSIEFFDTNLSTGEQFLAQKGFTLFSWIALDAKVFNNITVESKKQPDMESKKQPDTESKKQPDMESKKPGVVNGNSQIYQLNDPPPISDQLLLTLIHEHSIILHVEAEILSSGTPSVPRWTQFIGNEYSEKMHIEELKIQDTQPIQRIAVMSDSSTIPIEYKSKQEELYLFQDILVTPWEARSPWDKKTLFIWETQAPLESSELISSPVEFSRVKGTETMRVHCANELDVIMSFLKWWASCDVSWKVALICPDFLYSLQYIRERCEELGIVADFYKYMATSTNISANSSNIENESSLLSWSSFKKVFDRTSSITKHYAIENRYAIKHGGIPGVVVISLMDYFREFCKEESSEFTMFSNYMKRKQQLQFQQKQAEICPPFVSPSIELHGLCSGRKKDLRTAVAEIIR